ncbi:MAG: alpha/beta hydrolase, partial [Flammeovirgaceae bacterium]
MRIILAVFFSLTLFIACNRQAQPEDQATETVLTVASGTVKRLADFESKYVTKRNVDIWLPDDYSTTEKYAVLYMHDGQLLFDSTDTWNKQEWGVDEALSALLQNGEVRKTIVVGVWNISKERHADYFPQKPFESLPKELQDSLLQANRGPDQPLFGTDVRADHYLKFLVEELKPYIDANFSTLTEAEHTFVAGSSMGGLISMYAICEYPEVFSGAACISTHWPGTFTVENNPIPAAFRSYLQANLPDPTT